jgi:hypothetical protein
MNWNNIDLKSNYEASQNILEPLSFDILLLEIHCNAREINEATVTAQFEEDLRSKIASAREIFKANLVNIVNHAKEERAKP